MRLNDRAQESANSSKAKPAGGRSGDTVLSRALDRARSAILWERLWPALAAPATAVGLFLAVSWLGLWMWLPPMGRAIGVCLFFLLAAAATLPLLRLRLPSREDALRRLDSRSGLQHRPATTIADDIATPSADPYSLALWRAHVERALRSAKALKAGPPMPRLAKRDPFALRALVLMLVIATFVAAGGDRMRRIAMAFDWQGVMVPANFRIDAWVNPPTYTGKPPVILPGLRPGEAVQTAANPAPALAVPAGSTLVIRSTGDIHLDVAVTGGLSDPSAAAPGDGKAADAKAADTKAADTKAAVASNAPKGSEERRFTINNAGSATVRGVGANDVTWQFTAIPNRPPTIALTKDPEVQPSGGLQLTYKLEDEYGVVDARATFKLKNEPGPNGQAAPRSLFEAPDFALGLPQARTRNGVGQTTKDVTEHPWAGATTVMTLVAKDEAGLEGRSEPFELRLPERPFSKPMARALIEQRRILALDADAQANVLTALDALTLAPEHFNMESKVYLGLRSIFYQLAHAQSDDSLREVVARMWDMAVNLEDGNVSDAQQALRAAEEALRNALERGASDEEIKRLTDNLRAALDKFMQALAEQLRQNPQALSRPLDPNAQRMRPQDLQSMIDRMEQMAKNGNRQAAQQLLDQMQAMLDNLQMGQQQQGQDDVDDEMQAMMDELADLTRQQQELRDKTFQQGQDQRRQRQQGQRGQQNQQGQRGQQNQQGQQGDQNGMGDLQQRQQALRDQLKKLLEEMRKNGMGQQPGQGQQGQGQQGQGQQGQQQGQGEGDQLGEADQAMGDAQGQLGQGNADGAVDSQGRALDALRRGQQSMAQAMQQQGNQMGMGPGGRPGGPGRPGRLGPARADQQTDPLGRPLRGHDYGDDSTVKVPGEIDAQRARRILEELRKRFGEIDRPQLELDYIERLLKDF
jgi:uncharacterized protein (TIGR02302 family)